MLEGSYPLFTLQKSNATVRYESAFSLRYFEYRLMNGDISYAILAPIPPAAPAVKFDAMNLKWIWIF